MARPNGQARVWPSEWAGTREGRPMAGWSAWGGGDGLGRRPSGAAWSGLPSDSGPTGLPSDSGPTGPDREGKEAEWAEKGREAKWAETGVAHAGGRTGGPRSTARR